MADAKKKVFVGMSGGVDSSVSAALLLEQGYDVVGVFIKVWQADFLPCTWREERRDAMRAAAHLNIPLLTLDLEKEYKEGVVDYMIREYNEGRVPNPDVMCNKHVKFGAFLDFAKKNGADFIATGHYARIESVQSLSLYRLLAGVDKEKDQSYFLWTLTERELAHTLFPVGHLEKKEVRALALKFGLPNAEKKDSQGLCFMGAVDMKDFLKHYLKTEVGNVLDESGKIIGTHEGAMLYAIGQRHGFHTEKLSAHQTPLFVIEKNLPQNTITVGQRIASRNNAELPKITLESINDIGLCLGETPITDIHARIRYRGALHPISINATERGALVTFSSPSSRDEYISKGQSMVMYRGEQCLGGGIIA